MSTCLRFYFGSMVATTLSVTYGLTAAFAADFPIGSYAPRGGTTMLTFDLKGQFRVTDKDAMVVEGHYKISGDRLEVTDVQGPWACTGAKEKTGAYIWKVSDTGLSFTTVMDLCQDRVQSLTATKWERQQ